MSRESLRVAFAESMYGQFTAAYDAGVRQFECTIPVVSEATNRITLGGNAKELPKMPHRVTIGRHPIGKLFHVAVESSLGMSCPDPLEALGLDIARMSQDALDGPEVSRHRGLLVISSARKLELRGADYDGNYYNPIQGLDQDMQQLFVAQVAGVAMARVSDAQSEVV